MSSVSDDTLSTKRSGTRAIDVARTITRIRGMSLLFTTERVCVRNGNCIFLKVHKRERAEKRIRNFVKLFLFLEIA